MKTHVTLWAAGALVLAANGLALLHASRNRAGAPLQRVTLSERDLRWSPKSDDSSVTLRLDWTQRLSGKPWISEEGIRGLGFDLSEKPNEGEPWRTFRRQGTRSAYVAFRAGGAEAASGAADARLAPIDAALDGESLLARHGGKRNVVVLPVSVRPYLRSQEGERPGGGAGERFLDLQIMDVPSEVHVPLPLSEGWRHRQPGGRLEVTLEYGRYYEPRVVGVKFR